MEKSSAAWPQAQILNVPRGSILKFLQLFWDCSFLSKACKLRRNASASTKVGLKPRSAYFAEIPRCRPSLFFDFSLFSSKMYLLHSSSVPQHSISFHPSFVEADFRAGDVEVDCREYLTCPDWKIRAITRDPSKE